MELKKASLKELQDILRTDYGASLDDVTANELGVGLLRITRPSLSAFARMEENTHPVERRNDLPSKANTSE